MIRYNHRTQPSQCLCPGEIHIPEGALPETARQDEICRYLIGMADAFHAVGYPHAPLTLFFNVVGERNENRGDRAFLVTLDERVRDALMRNLDVVQKREGGKPRVKLLRFDIGPRTTFRSAFEQIAEIPMTVFGLHAPNPENGGFLFANFFLRTPFTISELRKEMHWATFVPVDAKPAPVFEDN